MHYCLSAARGCHKTVEMVDELKDLGFLYATKSGLSIGVDDMVIPAGEGPSSWSSRPAASRSTWSSSSSTGHHEP